MSAAATVGYREVPWNSIVYGALIFQMMLAMLSQYARKDQITITACALGVYFMEFPESLRRWRFRQLVAMFVVSLIYDIVWFFIVDDNADDEGGLEYNIKKFSRIVGYISFLWRIIVVILLEKASLDFLHIVKGQNKMGSGNDLFDRVESIIQKGYEEGYVKSQAAFEHIERLDRKATLKKEKTRLLDEQF